MPGRAARGIEDDLKDLKDSVDDVSNAISLGFGADMLVDLAGGMMDLMESTDELRGDLVHAGSERTRGQVSAWAPPGRLCRS